MRDLFRQAMVVVTVLATLVINGLANALPLNGMTTGEISDRFQVFFTPAGYVFSIWGVIYLGLIAFAVFQSLPSQRQNPRLRAVGWWIALGGLANCAWILLWHYELFPLTLVAMLVLLASLVVAYLRLDIGRSAASPAERWVVHLLFSVYLAWITVATVANVTVVLDYLHWDGFGLAPEIWMGLVLAVIVAITAAMNFTRRDVAFSLVILWALLGISFKQADHLAVVIPTSIAFGLAALTLAAALAIHRPEQGSSKDM